MLGNGAIVSYARIGPTLAKNGDGDWYVGCQVTATGAPNVPGLQISCYRVDTDTLEVTNIPNGQSPEEKPCESLPGWPQQ